MFLCIQDNIIINIIIIIIATDVYNNNNNNYCCTYYYNNIKVNYGTSSDPPLPRPRGLINPETGGRWGFPTWRSNFRTAPRH